MALSMLSFWGFVAILLIEVFPGSESRNFPLVDCTRNQMDILTMSIDKDDIKFLFQKRLQDHFIQHVINLPSNRTTSRVMCADVYYSLHQQKPNVNLRDWQFNTCNNSRTYSTYNEVSIYHPIASVQEILKAKITFAGRLFSEMSGVRENATHIAVIYLDATGYSLDEAKTISRIVQEQSTEIKIFLILLGVENLKETIHMSDTLVLHCNTVSIENILAMAICKQCIDGWILFEHTDSTDYLSCYNLNDAAAYRTDWFLAMKHCHNFHGYLAGIETREELNFLQTWFKWYFTGRLNLGDHNGNGFHHMAQVYIGLHRDLESIAKRFQWSLGKATLNRPLVVNNWMSGKPSGGYNNAACGVWQFVWDGLKNDTNISSIGDSFVEGWADVGCRTELSNLSLCEVVLARRVEDNIVMRISPASKNIFAKTLSRRNLKKVGDNIVSVSAYIGSTDNAMSVNDSISHFPIFDCGEDAGYPRYISYLFVCDSIDHCSNRRDEASCTTMSHSANICTDSESYCRDAEDSKAVYCCDGSCLPSQLVNDGEIDCTICMQGTENVFNDETGILNMHLRRNETCAFICNVDTCVHFSQLNDGQKDCGETDGPLDETIGKLETANTCFNILSHRVWAPKCVYVKDRYGAILGCRDMSHLKDCKDYECPEGYVKCPNTYCIPQHYVLDGNIDCPKGEDEHNDMAGSCSGNFACWDSKMCLHPDLVCDGHPECPQGDDEMDCDDWCQPGFRCVSGTVTVSDYKQIDYSYDLPAMYTEARYLDLSGADLHSLLTYLVPLLDNAILIILSNCKIRSFNDVLNLSPRRAQTIDISYNLMQTFSLREVDYQTLQHIRHLNLSYNKELAIIDNLRFKYLENLDLSRTGLSYLNNSFLVGLPKLKYLNLSYTFISDFPDNVFSSNFSLRVLDVRGLSTYHYYEDLFNGLTISQHLYTDNFEMCCPQIRGQNIPSYTCHSPENRISSCFDLVRIHVQEILLWIIAVLAVLGNTAVLVYHFIWDKSVVHAGYGMFLTHLSISDVIMGVYLFIICGASYYYRGIYVLYGKSWRESGLCKFAGFLATLSTRTATFFIFLITLDRFLVMKFPFSKIKLTKISGVIALLLCWIISFLLALLPLVFKLEIYSTNAMCLGLPVATKRPIELEYTFGLFIVQSVIMFLIIAYGQIAIYRSLSQKGMPRLESNTVSYQPQDITVTKQLSLLTVSNLVCWFPIGVVGLLTLVENLISNDLYAWTMIIMIPINCATNPLLSMLLTFLRRWKNNKYANTSTHSTHS